MLWFCSTACFDLCLAKREKLNIKIKNSVFFDGTDDSVYAIMDLLGRMSGINNTPEGLYINDEVAFKGDAICKVGDDFMIVRGENGK